jgi:hypothetical protein
MEEEEEEDDDDDDDDDYGDDDSPFYWRVCAKPTIISLFGVMNVSKAVLSEPVC